MCYACLWHAAELSGESAWVPAHASVARGAPAPSRSTPAPQGRVPSTARRATGERCPPYGRPFLSATASSPKMRAGCLLTLLPPACLNGPHPSPAAPGPHFGAAAVRFVVIPRPRASFSKHLTTTRSSITSTRRRFEKDTHVGRGITKKRRGCHLDALWGASAPK